MTIDASIRPITAPTRFHWFGYYDKFQTDPTDRYVLGMRVDFEHRSPRANDTVQIGMIDTRDGDRWIELGETSSWGWQQGCMLQWRPGSDSEVLWNERHGDRYVCRILNVHTRESRIIGCPIYTVTPDGKFAAGTDFRRINDMRPGYGYAGIPDPHASELAPDESGIYVVPLDADGVAEGSSNRLIVSLAQIAAIPYPHGDLSTAKHYFNHLLFNTDGTRLEFLHRWRFGSGGFHTRMVTANTDGSDVTVVDHSGKTSHFIWRDPSRILAWSDHPSHGDAFYLYRDREVENVEVVGKGQMVHNGHCTYLPNADWVLNDTYPLGDERRQELYLYHVPTATKVPLGGFHAPPAYTGEWRCDLHPRANRDGTKVYIDSAHGGNGRQMYELDIRAILDSV